MNELASVSQHLTPAWAVVPFIGYLLLIAILPLVVPRLWESNRNKLILAIAAGIPAIVYLVGQSHDGVAQLLRTGLDYVSFMALLGALFAISGGICLRGQLVGTPLVNTALLGAGALLASLVGTTGASALLVRPLLRANTHRVRSMHIVVFFIFIVANSGGLLTPLGDPPLFLGFLRGVPFTWTLRLAPAWLLVNGVLLALFATFDHVAFVRDRGKARPPRPSDPAIEVGPLRIEGGVNAVWLLGIVGVVFATGLIGPHLARFPHIPPLIQIVGMALCATLAWVTTPRAVREVNRFSWAPMVEVAAVFLGVFITMIPALSYLEQRGASLGITRPAQFFWATGALSSVLDNAPTYLTFASLALGVADAGSGTLSAAGIGALATHPVGERLLAAVSCGAVMMGAVTYIGNGPNFMVKAIAEQHRVRTPSFFGYVAWSGVILLPLFALVAHLFFEAMEMRYPRTGEPIVPRLLRPLMLDRHAVATFPVDPESELIAYDELGPDAWHRLPHETCRRVSLFVVDRVQTRLRALPDAVLDTQLPPPADALALPLERRTVNTLRRADTSSIDAAPWTIRRYLEIARFGGRALVDLLAALEVHAGPSQMPSAASELGGVRMSDRLLLSIARRLPATEASLELDPVREGSSIWPLDFRQLIKTAARLGHEIPFRVIELGGARVVVRLGQMTAARATYRVAVRTVQALGAATIDAIAAQIRATVDPTVDAVFVERLLTGLPAFRWLDRRAGWFWFVQRSNPLISDLRKVLSVVTSVPVTRLAAALFRMRAGPRPSPAAVQGLCTAVPEARVRNGIVTVDRLLDRRAHLNEGETRVVKVLESARGSLSDGQLRGRVRAIGLSWTPVWRILRSSPLFERTPEGLFRLLGSG